MLTVYSMLFTVYPSKSKTRLMTISRFLRLAEDDRQSDCESLTAVTLTVLLVRNHWIGLNYILVKSQDFFTLFHFDNINPKPFLQNSDFRNPGLVLTVNIS